MNSYVKDNKKQKRSSMAKNARFILIVTIFIVVICSLMSSAEATIEVEDDTNSIVAICTSDKRAQHTDAGIFDESGITVEKYGVLTAEQSKKFDSIKDFILSAATIYSQPGRNYGTHMLIQAVENGLVAEDLYNGYVFDCSSFCSVLCYELYGIDCNIYDNGNAYTTYYFHGDTENFSSVIYIDEMVEPTTLKKGQLLLCFSYCGGSHIMFCCGNNMILHCDGRGVVYEEVSSAYLCPGWGCNEVVVLTPKTKK